MKKTLALSFLLISQLSCADTLFGIYAGAQSWLFNTSGNIKANNANYNNAFSRIDKNSQSSNSYFFALEHGVPFVPNIKLKQTNLEIDNFVNLDLICTLDFPNHCFPDTTIDLSHTDLTLYYEVLDNWVNLDLGISALYFGGKVDFDTGLNADINYSKIVPALYGKALFEMPLTDLSASLAINLGRTARIDMTNIELAVEYKLAYGFSIQGGVRQQNITLDGFDGTSIDTNSTGVFAGLNFHF